jgi:hypothetical protein
MLNYKAKTRDGYKTYWLVDRRTGQPFYVGQTVYMLQERLIAHIRAARNNPKYPVQQRIVSMNYEVDIVLVERFSRRCEAMKNERFWMRELNDMGMPVTNIIKRTRRRKSAIA